MRSRPTSPNMALGNCERLERTEERTSERGRGLGRNGKSLWKASSVSCFGGDEGDGISRKIDR